MDAQEMAGKAQDWKEKAQNFKQQAQELQESAVQRARETGQAVNDYVQDNVWLSMGMAAVLGCVIGWLLASNRD